jgi:hypothetical protein
MAEQSIARRKVQELFRQNAFAAWKEYQATGLHSNAKEADACLAKLQAGEKAKAPECRV